jgi:hypothetical protein
MHRNYEKYTRTLLGKLKGREEFRNLGVHVEIVLK